MPLNADELAALYDEHARVLLAFLVRRTHDADAAVDLLAETFAAAFEDRDQFRGRGGEAARAWLYGIARHRLSDFFRRGFVEKNALERLGVDRRPLVDAEYERIEELGESRELRSRVAAEFADLPGKYRDVLRLRVIEEKPYAEVARALGITEQTARAQTSRGLRALRQARLLPDDSEAVRDV